MHAACKLPNALPAGMTLEISQSTLTTYRIHLCMIIVDKQVHALRSSLSCDHYGGPKKFQKAYKTLPYNIT